MEVVRVMDWLVGVDWVTEDRGVRDMDVMELV